MVMDLSIWLGWPGPGVIAPTFIGATSAARTAWMLGRLAVGGGRAGAAQAQSGRAATPRLAKARLRAIALTPSASDRTRAQAQAGMSARARRPARQASPEQAPGPP